MIYFFLILFFHSFMLSMKVVFFLCCFSQLPPNAWLFNEKKNLSQSSSLHNCWHIITTIDGCTTYVCTFLLLLVCFTEWMKEKRKQIESKKNWLQWFFSLTVADFYFYVKFSIERDTHIHTEELCDLMVKRFNCFSIYVHYVLAQGTHYCS